MTSERVIMGAQRAAMPRSTTRKRTGGRGTRCHCGAILNADRAKRYLIDRKNPTGYAKAIEEHDAQGLARSYVLGHDIIAQTDDGAEALLFLKDGPIFGVTAVGAGAAALTAYGLGAYGRLMKEKMSPWVETGIAFVADYVVTAGQVFR